MGNPRTEDKPRLQPHVIAERTAVRAMAERLRKELAAKLIDENKKAAH